LALLVENGHQQITSAVTRVLVDRVLLLALSTAAN